MAPINRHHLPPPEEQEEVLRELLTEKCRALFSLARDSLRLSHQFIISILDRDRHTPDDTLHGIIKHTFIFITNNFHSIIVLAQSGFPIHVLMIIRSTFEWAVHIKYLLHDESLRHDRARRFWFYRFVAVMHSIEAERERLVKAGIPFDATAWCDLPEWEAEVRRICDEYRGKYRTSARDRSWNKHPFGLSVAELATELGMLADYNYIYRFGSGVSHAGPEALSAITERDGRTDVLNLGPTPDRVDVFLSLAARMQLDLLQIVAVALKAEDHVTEIKALRERLAALKPS